MGSNLTSFNSLLGIEMLFQRPPTNEVMPAIHTTPPVPSHRNLQPVRKRSVIVMVRPLSQVHLMAARALREQQMGQVPNPVAESGVASGAF